MLPLLSDSHQGGISLPDKSELLARFEGKELGDIQTPHVVIDQDVFERNCAKMKSAVDRLGWDFRAHIKTHKTPEGTALQCTATGPRIICSTFPEIWHIINSGLVEKGKVNDILYSMPLPVRLIESLDQIKQGLQKNQATLRLMIDNVAQIEALADYAASKQQSSRWSIFLKVDFGTRRAGLPPSSDAMKQLVTTALKHSQHVSIFGTYTHAGFSYGSRSGQDAASYLTREVEAAGQCAELVYEIGLEMGKAVGEDDSNRLRIAVGATPTAHASQEQWKSYQDALGGLLQRSKGILELHAGNYCLLDSQQVGTNLVSFDDCALTISATVISTYPERQEALCDAGSIAMSFDRGPIPGLGVVVSPPELKGWTLGRVSQEHGILTFTEGQTPEVYPKIGQRIVLVPQHACVTAAQHSWFFVVQNNARDDRSKVVDVWIPAKGW